MTLYIVKELYVYTENTFEVDDLIHIVTTNYSKALNKLKELKSNSFEYLSTLKNEPYEVHETNNDLIIKYLDNCDRKEIQLLKYEIDKDIFVLQQT